MVEGLGFGFRVGMESKSGCLEVPCLPYPWRVTRNHERHSPSCLDVTLPTNLNPWFSSPVAVHDLALRAAFLKAVSNRPFPSGFAIALSLFYMCRREKSPVCLTR